MVRACRGASSSVYFFQSSGSPVRSNCGPTSAGVEPIRNRPRGTSTISAPSLAFCAVAGGAVGSAAESPVMSSGKQSKPQMR